MPLTHKTCLALAVLALAAATPAARAQTYDAAKDFSAMNNPNGAWSYGYETSLGSPLNLYTDKASFSTSIAGWNYDISSNVPLVVKNFGTSDDGFADVILHPGQLAFHPGSDDEFSVVRFTASQAGTYNLVSGFTPVTTDGTTTDVHVLEDGTSLFDGFVTGTYDAPTSAPTFSDSLHLNAGDTVDFAVGYGTNDNFYDDSTGLSATFNPPSGPVPEASTLISTGLLLCLGLGGLAVNTRRRKAPTAQ